MLPHDALALAAGIEWTTPTHLTYPRLHRRDINRLTSLCVPFPAGRGTQPTFLQKRLQTSMFIVADIFDRASPALLTTFGPNTPCHRSHTAATKTEINFLDVDSTTPAIEPLPYRVDRQSPSLAHRKQQSVLKHQLIVGSLQQ